MSSEGSVASSSSRLRQFGLYRTIDAKTDEFLRSSRKRQITQGCACAAISTAITVTVVVSVILVYEYSINIDANKTKKIAIKPNWLGVSNDSDTTLIDQKYMKSINLDKSSLKLLPILLKALNENRYLEKIIEGYSSSSPPNEKTDNTENYVKRNIFSDAKNWLKMPSPKIYTLDYKTTPLIFIKRPSQHLEYLTKIRKMKNYERMLNYFDKMINEKVAFSKPSNTGKLNYEYTENPLKFTTKQKKISGKKKLKIKSKLRESVKKHKETQHRPPKASIKHHSNDSNVNCKCPKDMGNLLSKLIQSLQQIVPHSENTQATPCAKKLKKKKLHHNFAMNLMTQISTSSINPRLLIHSTSTSSTNLPEILLSPSKRKYFALPLSVYTKTEETTKGNNMETTTENYSILSIMNEMKMETLAHENETATTIINETKSMQLEPQTEYKNAKMLFRTEPKIVEIRTEPTTIEIRTQPSTIEIVTQPTTTEFKTEESTFIMQTEPTMNDITTDATTIEIKTMSTTNKIKTEDTTIEINTQAATDESEAETVIIKDKEYSTTEATIFRPKYLSEEQVVKDTTEFPLMYMATYMKDINKPKPYYDKIHHLAKFISKTDRFSTTISEDLLKYHDYTTLSSPFTSEPILEAMPMYEVYETKPTTTPGHETTPITIATTEKKTTTTTEVIVPVKFNDADEGFLSNENFVETAAVLPQYKSPIVPMFKEEDYDYVMVSKSKEPDTGTNKHKMVEKTDNLKNNMRKIGYRSRLSNYHPVIKNKDIDMNNLRKMADIVQRKKKLIQETTTPINNKTRGDQGNHKAQQNDKSTPVEHNIKTHQGKKKLTGVLKRIMKSNIESTLLHNAGNKHEQNLLSKLKPFQAVSNDSEDELFQESHNNQSEKNIYDEIPQSAQYDADKMKSVDKLISIPYKSMLPPIRTGYLEVRRNNDWKPEDQSDYDSLNLANNFFDMPNN